jgi:hypothetical protein
MLMADTMAIFFVILGLLLAFPGLWLLCRGLWPTTVSGAAHRCRNQLLKSFLVGAPITALIILFAVAAGKVAGGVGAILSIAIVCAFSMLASAGVAGFATCIGERLASPGDGDRPWKATLRGGIVLELSYLLPILGWFVILPVSLIVGCGAATLSLIGSFRVSSPAKTAPASTPEVSGFIA